MYGSDVNNTNHTLNNKERLIGNNKIWCWESLITGRNYFAMIFSSLLILVPTILLVFVILNASEVYSNTAKIILVIIIGISSITGILFVFLAGCTDPGILKRKVDYNIRRKFDMYEKTDFKLVTKGSIIKYTICYTCNLVRPPRCSHCAECENCTERFDHHCIWIGTCVGKRNYKRFIFFLICLNSTAVFNLIVSSYTLIKEVDNYIDYKDLNKSSSSSNNFNSTNADAILSNDTYYDDLSQSEQDYKANIGISSSVIFFTLAFVVVFLGKLMVDHLILASKNITFYEDIKKKFNNPFGNPHHKGNVLKNFYFLLCKRTPKQSLNYSKIYFNPYFQEVNYEVSNTYREEDPDVIIQQNIGKTNLKM